MEEEKKNRLRIEDPDARRRTLRRAALTGQILVAVLGIVLWEGLTRIGWIDSYYWSSPLTIIRTGWKAATVGTLLPDLAYTSGATIIGFVLGTTCGSVLGLSFWWSRLYERIAEPYLVALNAVPKLALAPVLVIMFGIGFASKVTLAFLMTVIVAAIAASGGVRSVDRDLEKMLVSLGARRRDVFYKIVVPSSIPWIVGIFKINISLALAGTIVGEFISSRQGVGRMILYAGQILDIDLVWVGVVVLSLLSIVMYLGTAAIERLMMKSRLPKS